MALVSLSPSLSLAGGDTNQLDHMIQSAIYEHSSPGSSFTYRLPSTVPSNISSIEATRFVGYPSQVALRVTTPSGQQYVRVPVKWKTIALFSPGVVPAGTDIHESDLVMKEVPVVGGRSNYLQPFKGVYRSVVTLSPKFPILSRNVTRPYIVKRDTTIVAFIRQGSLTASVDVVVRRPARLGDTVEAYNKVSGRKVHVSITGPTTGEVRL